MLFIILVTLYLVLCKSLCLFSFQFLYFLLSQKNYKNMFFPLHSIDPLFYLIPYAIHHTCYPLPCAFLWYMHRISFYLVVCCTPWWSTCYSILVLTLGPLLETVWREFLYPLCDFRGTLGFPKFLACLELDRALFRDLGHFHGQTGSLNRFIVFFSFLPYFSLNLRTFLFFCFIFYFFWFPNVPKSVLVTLNQSNQLVNQLQSIELVPSSCSLFFFF